MAAELDTCYACKKYFRASPADAYMLVLAVLPLTAPDVNVCPSCQRLCVVTSLMLIAELNSRKVAK